MYDRLLVRFDHLYCCERCYSSLIINGCESALMTSLQNISKFYR
jgi:hypothetical protein